MDNKNTGLVLEGGAMRGIFTAGVIDVFMENGIDFPAFVGVSAGAAFGCNLKSRQPGRVLRYNLRFCRDPKYCSIRSLIKTGDMFGAEFCYRTLPEELDVFDFKAFEENPMGFYAVCSDIETGKPFYKKIEKGNSECYDWIRASASMPLVSRIVELDGKKYLDGGVTDSIPIRFMETMYNKNVVVLTRPRDYIKQPASHLWMFRRTLKNYPNMMEAIKNRHIMYNETRDYLFSQEREGNAFIICPKEPLEIKRVEHNAEMIQKTYDIGRKASLEKLDELKRFIENDN